MSFSNDCASLDFYKQSLKRKVQDFMISFNEEQTDIQQVLIRTKDLFVQLIDTFQSKVIHARLVAKVRFIHVNSMTNEMEERFYHFPSYKTECVLNADEFYHQHMEKIAQRLDSFNKNGSNLLIKNIDHIHILLTVNEGLSCKRLE